LNGVDRDMIFIYTPISPDERRSLKYMSMINNQIKPENMFKPWIDYDTYRIYINQCDESDLKATVLQQIEVAMIEAWQNPQAAQDPEIWWALQWVAASAWSQAMWSFLKQNQAQPAPL